VEIWFEEHTLPLEERERQNKSVINITVVWAKNGRTNRRSCLI